MIFAVLEIAAYVCFIKSDVILGQLRASPHKTQNMLSVFSGDNVSKGLLPKWEIGSLP